MRFKEYLEETMTDTDTPQWITKIIINLIIEKSKTISNPKIIVDELNKWCKSSNGKNYLVFDFAPNPFAGFTDTYGIFNFKIVGSSGYILIEFGKEFKLMIKKLRAANQNPELPELKKVANGLEYVLDWKMNQWEFKRHERNLKNEEYFTRLEKFEIFKNPSNKEITDLFKIRKAMRALVDFKNKVYFLFDSDLLHQTASKAIAKEYEGMGYFYCMEVYMKNQGIRVRLADDLFKIKAKQSMWVNGIEFPSPSRKEQEWFKNKFKLLGEISEEYYARSKKAEVFKNPSMKEFKQAEKASMKDDKFGFIRILIDKKTNDVFLSSGRMLHDEIAEVIDKENDTEYSFDYKDYYYPLVGNFEDNTLHLTNSSIVKFTQDEEQEIMDIMEKKTYFKIDYRRR